MIKKVIKLGASWCGPCKALEPTLKSISEMEEYKDVEFKSLDIEEDDDAQMLVDEYSVRSVPTVLFFDENNEMKVKQVGNVPKDSIIDILNNN